MDYRVNRPCRLLLNSLNEQFAQTFLARRGLVIVFAAQSAKIISVWSAAALLGLYAAGCTTCKTGAAPCGFRQLDGDGDGRITPAEFKAGLKQAAFAKMDRDGDGQVDRAEWSAAGLDADKAGNTFDAVDRDRSRRISFLEFSDAVDKSVNLDDTFTAMDRDRDGHIAPDEFNVRPAFKIFSIQL